MRLLGITCHQGLSWSNGAHHIVLSKILTPLLTFDIYERHMLVMKLHAEQVPAVNYSQGPALMPRPGRTPIVAI